MQPIKEDKTTKEAEKVCQRFMNRGNKVVSPAVDDLAALEPMKDLVIIPDAGENSKPE